MPRHSRGSHGSFRGKEFCNKGTVFSPIFRFSSLTLSSFVALIDSANRARQKASVIHFCALNAQEVFQRGTVPLSEYPEVFEVDGNLH